MRLTMRTDLALRILMFCAVNEGRVVRKVDIAQACDASENHLAQVIQALAQTGYIDTLRGRSGGMRLGRSPASINVGDVCRRFEGEFAFVPCFHEEDCSCPLRKACALRGLLAQAVEAFYSTLDSMTISDLVKGNAALHQLLAAARPMRSPQSPAATPLPMP